MTCSGHEGELVKPASIPHLLLGAGYWSRPWEISGELDGQVPYSSTLRETMGHRPCRRRHRNQSSPCGDDGCERQSSGG